MSPSAPGPAPASGPAPETLGELLRGRARTDGERRIAIVDGNGQRSLSTAALLDAAERAAAGLVDAGARPGQPVLILARDAEDWLTTFWGAVLAGALPTSAAGPRDASERERQRIERAVAALGEPVVVVERGFGDLARAQLGMASRALIVDAAELRASSRHFTDHRSDASASAAPAPASGDIAFLQMSSGSTREPRPVLITHGSVIAQLGQLAGALPLSRDDVNLSWMPLFHDMGLVGGHLESLFLGMREVRMDPALAMSDPLRWLEVAAAERATILSSTCLGLERATRALERVAPSSRPDLRAVRMMATGAEPIRADVLRGFSRAAGVDERVHFPLYGLAEAVVGVSAPRAGGVRTVCIGGADSAHERVVCGAPLPDVEVRIVDDELLVRGPNVTRGYRRADGSVDDTELFADGPERGWLRTRDLARLVDGEVVIVGRRKDVVIVDGRNVHAADIEELAEAVPGVKTGGAVFVADARHSPERPTLLVVIEREASAWDVAARARRSAESEIGARPSVIVVEKLPRTTSGKKRRAELREQLERGELDGVVHASTLDLVREAWSRALGREIARDDVDTAFRDAGGTSLGAARVLAFLAERGVRADHRLLMRGDTIRALARVIEHGELDVDVDNASLSATASAAAADEPIAIISLALRVAGARGPRALFALAKSGETRIGRAPTYRKLTSAGAFLDDDPALFDAARFGIAAADAVAMDPQQRLLLTVADEARARAGIALDDVTWRECGVFVGAGQQAYLERILPRVAERGDRALPASALPGNLLNMIAARVAHQFDLRGPALSVDTACSSSLVALHLACRALRAGDCRIALVGGVHLTLSDTLSTLFAKAGALSPSGKCTPFIAGADGTVPGEAALAVVVAPLSLAEERGWPVLAVIRASAVNNDGASLGVMAPNPAGQESVIRRALASSNVEVSKVTVVEAHGTGTPVGDEVERSVLGRAYPHAPRLTATKGVVGHAMAAAGLVGLARLLGELKDGDLGAVSSFGFGGTNAHAIVEGAWRRVPESALDDGAVPTTRYWFDDDDSASPFLRRDAVVVVTGATGALGTALVKELAPLGLRVLLVGSRADHRAQPLLDVVTRAGGEARYCQADLATADGARAVREAARDLASKNAGVVDVLFHLAGALEPKRAKALKLAALLRLEAMQPRAIVLSSSIAAQNASFARGIEGYAEANRELDEYAASAPAESHVVSVALPALREAGRGAGLASSVLPLLEERGVPVVDVAEGARMLIEALGRPATARSRTERTASSSLDAPHVVPPGRYGGSSPVGFAPRPSHVDLRLVEHTLRQLVGHAIGREPADVDVNASFPSLGLDSLAAVDVTKGIEDVVGRELPITFLYEHDTIAKAVEALTVDVERASERGAEAPPHKEEEAAATPTGGRLALTPAQLAFVAQRSLFPDMAGNVMLAVSVDDGRAPLEDSELRAALDVLSARHPALSAAVARDAAGYFQVSGAAPELRRVTIVDDELENEIAGEVFDLQRGPLFRVITDGRRLVLNGHHAAIDAWSVRNVLLELLELVAAGRARREPDLPPLASTIAEAYSLARQAGSARDISWWTSRLSDAAPLHLPWNAAVDAPSSGGAGVALAVLDGDATAQIRQQAAAAGVTLPAWMLAAWMRTLFDASGQHDVVVRTAQGKRTARLPDIDKLVGAFADALPVRAKVAIDDDTAAVAKRVHAFLIEAQAHGDVSSQELADALPRGSAGPVGISPVGFSFPLLPSTAKIAGFHVDDVVGRAAAGFSRATLVAFLAGDRLQLSLSYARSHVDAKWAQDIVDDVARHARDLPRAPRPATLHGRVLERCALHPERIAVAPDFTYGTLARRSAALATRLLPHVDDRRRIAVFAEPSADAVVALLAVLRTGSAYVPLDPHWPDGRVVDVLSIARPSAIVCPATLVERAEAAASDVPILVIGDDEADAGPLVEDDNARLAYVMFTSGSTGKPKGVAVSHAACLTFQEWVRRAFDVDETARFAQTSSLAFGGSVRQIFSALLAGARIHPVSHELLRDPEALVRFLHEERITIWNSVPSLWVHLMDAAERSSTTSTASPVARPFEHLRAVLIGGEPVPAAHVRRWRSLERASGTSTRLFNLYGSVETIVNATWFEVVRDPADDDVHTPIGWARAGTDVALVDAGPPPPAPSPRDAGAVGEIAVSGAIADGYLDDPQLTRARFVDGAYRTGDLAKRLADGSLVHMGRSDGQVQVHGNRVELVEIEHALAAHRAVRRAAVAWTGRALVASVEVRDEHRAVDVRALREFVAARLPAFMVPHKIDVVSALPRTPAGKVDRLALSRDATPTSAATARDDVASALADAWRDVLELREPIRDYDDFFALGGDSIRAIEVLDRLRAALPGASTLRPMALYRHRRFGELKRAIESALAASTTTASPWSRVDPRKLSSVQRGFYLAQQQTGHSPTWAALVTLRGRLDDAAFNRAVATLMKRHPLLRASFAPDERGNVVATFHDEVPPPLVVHDASGLGFDFRATWVLTKYFGAAYGKLDPGHAPLFSLQLVHLPNDEHALVFASHHMISDAWSCFVMLAELTALLDGRALPPPPPSFAEVIAREPIRARDDDAKFWRAALAGLPQQPAAAGHSGTVALRVVSKRVTDAIAKLARARRTTPFAVVLDAFARALDEPDVVISVAISGRDSAGDDAARVVGPFARALPVRIRARDGDLGATARALDDAIAHSDAPPATIALAAGPNALETLGRYFLSWLDPAVVPRAAASLDVDWAHSRFQFDTASTHTEIMIGAMPCDDGLVLHVHGGGRAGDIGDEVVRRLEALTDADVVDAALVIYPPADARLPVVISEPVVVETVKCALGTSRLVLVPVPADQLASTPDLAAKIERAVEVSEARVVALAGMLPSVLGLGVRDRSSSWTTGHAATVAAMFMTLQRVLEVTGLPWSEARVASIGFGSIGRATWELARSHLGATQEHVVVDPAIPGSARDASGCDIVLAATSGNGGAIDVDTLAPGTIVIDDSFPRAFDDALAWRRMRERRDVLLVGGGMLDVGPLERTSPFPQADAIRATLPVRWLPGCHVEALLFAKRAGFERTRGFVDVHRAREVLFALETLGVKAAPLHLGKDEIPTEVVHGVRGARTGRR